jgi:hypothetical protein
VHEEGDIRSETGFDFDSRGRVPVTPPPSKQELDRLRGPVAKLVAADYPDFAKRVWGIN